MKLTVRARILLGVIAGVILLAIGRIGAAYVAGDKAALNAAQWWMYAVLAAGYACLYFATRTLSDSLCGPRVTSHPAVGEVAHVLIVGVVVTVVVVLMFVGAGSAFYNRDCMLSSISLAWLTFVVAALPPVLRTTRGRAKRLIVVLAVLYVIVGVAGGIVLFDLNAVHSIRVMKWDAGKELRSPTEYVWETMNPSRFITAAAPAQPFAFVLVGLILSLEAILGLSIVYVFYELLKQWLEASPQDTTEER